MAQGLQNFTAQECQNIQLGQCRSAYISDTDVYTCKENEVIVAIQLIQDTKFETITQEDPSNCFGDTADPLSVSNTNGGIGDAVANSTYFPAGLVLYGRWTTIDLAAGIVVLYMAGK